MGGALYHARMNRTSWLAVVTLALLLGGVWLRLRWPDAAPAIDCPPGSVRLDDAGVAFCGDGAPLPAAKALTLGQKLDLNRASAEDLAIVSGSANVIAYAGIQPRSRDRFRPYWIATMRLATTASVTAASARGTKSTTFQASAWPGSRR